MKNKKKNVTWIDLAKRIFGTHSDKEAHDLLWFATCFPFGSILHVARQLKDLRIRSNGNFDVAMAIADKEMEEAMQEIRRLP